MRAALLYLSALLLFAQPAPDVLGVYADAAGALANNDPDAFMAKFDRATPGYATLHDEIEGLLNANDVSSTVEVVNESGDDHKRVMDLDWVLVVSQKNAPSGEKETRRQLLKCAIERQGKQWKITLLDPIEFFHY